MKDRRFAGCTAWMAAVERALAGPAAQSILTAKGLDADTVRCVARAEASHASDLGLSNVSPEQLAVETGVARPAVLRARVALIEFGLEDVVPGSGTASVRRELHHDPSI